MERTVTLYFCAISLKVSPARTRYRTNGAVGRGAAVVVTGIGGLGDTMGTGVDVDETPVAAGNRVDDGATVGVRVVVGAGDGVCDDRIRMTTTIATIRTIATPMTQKILESRSSSPKCGSAR